MPFDNPYFPTQFDVGTVNGPHVHMDKNGVDVTDGAGNHVKLLPSVNTGNVTVPAVGFNVNGHNVAFDAVAYATPAGSGLFGTSLFAIAAGKAGSSNATVELFGSDGVSPSQILGFAGAFHFKAGAAQTTDLVWDGSTVAINGTAPLGVTAQGLGSVAPNGEPALGQWFNGVGVQTNAATPGVGRGSLVFGIRNTDAVPNQPVAIVTGDGCWLIGKNDSANGFFPLGLTSRGLGGSTKGGITDPAGTITGGPYAVLGGWFAGIGIDTDSGVTDGSNSFGILANDGSTLFNITQSGRVQFRFLTSDAPAPSLSNIGGVLYCLNGALRYRGNNGTLTTIAPA